MNLNFGTTLTTRQIPCANVVLSWRQQHFITSCGLISSPTKERLELLHNVYILNPSLKNYSNEKLLNILLYGSEGFNCNMNKEILKATMKFLKISKPFLNIVCPNGTYFSHIFQFFFKFRYMYRTYFKRHVTFSKFCVLFGLVLAFFISCNL